MRAEARDGTPEGMREAGRHEGPGRGLQAAGDPTGGRDDTRARQPVAPEKPQVGACHDARF